MSPAVNLGLSEEASSMKGSLLQDTGSWGGQNKPGLSLESYRRETPAWGKRQNFAIGDWHKVAPALRHKTGPRDESRGSQELGTTPALCIPPA